MNAVRLKPYAQENEERSAAIQAVDEAIRTLALVLENQAADCRINGAPSSQVTNTAEAIRSLSFWRSELR